MNFKDKDSNKNKCRNKNGKYSVFLKLIIPYSVMAFIAVSISIVCHFVGLKYVKVSDFILCFIGVFGTAASIYSIKVSVQDEMRAKNESEENKRFMEKLSNYLQIILFDTESVRENTNKLLNKYSESNIVSGKKRKKGRKHTKDEDITHSHEWEPREDENPTT